MQQTSWIEFSIVSRACCSSEAVFSSSAWIYWV